MIKIVSGNIFESEMQTLVNAVNCVGVMGKGIALEFKKRFPEMYRDYTRRCRMGGVIPGRPYLYKAGGSAKINIKGPWVLNFPTKGDWREPSKIEYMEEGLEYLRRHYAEWGISSIAVPALGAGNGGLDWEDVLPVIYDHFSRFEKGVNGIEVRIYEPYDGLSVSHDLPVGDPQTR